MATNTNFFLVLLVVLGISIAMFSIPTAKGDDDVKETDMTIYFHDYASGSPNSTDLPVVGFPGKPWTFTQFGTLFVTDDPITEDTDINSTPVGRGQGIHVTTSLDGTRTYVSLSIIFTNNAYNGSTIQIQGNTDLFNPIPEYGVVSGTGQFRNAKGYVTFENIFFNPSTLYSTIRCNISILHI